LLLIAAAEFCVQKEMQNQGMSKGQTNAANKKGAVVTAP
jgi:hypothetical protein